MSALVSIIIPVYNVEKYLPRCIESVLMQSYENFELILVNDGSKDKSGWICDYYEVKDARIQVIHTINRGVSSARNIGMEKATAKYVMFIDSDDWIPSNALQVLVEKMETYPIEMAVGTLENRSKTIAVNSFNDSIVDLFGGDTDVTGILPRLTPPVNKLFLKSIIDEKQIRYPLEVKCGEDALFVYSYLQHCTKIYTSSQVTYYYNRLGEGTATQKKFDKIIEWKLAILQNFQSLLNKFPIEENQKLQVLDREACFEVSFCIRMWMGIVHGRKKAMHERIRECLTRFEPYLLWDGGYRRRYEVEIKDVIYTKDVAEIFRVYKRDMRKQNVRAKIRKFIKNVKRPFLEKYRDGIISIKEIVNLAERQQDEKI